MKATFDLPPELVRELKLRAVREGRKLKDAAADVLRAGLAAGARSVDTEKPATVTRDRKTGLPVIRCRRAPSRRQQLTPDRVADILAQQEADWAGA